jgi:uncharacterized membrane protein
MSDEKSTGSRETAAQKNHLRFHLNSRHLASAFGGDSFGRKAEQFARFFGTPTFLIVQSLIVTAWILANSLDVVTFDLYPFILLNLAFSLQAAYAAPLILLAQTRQADRDKANAENDAMHREALAQQNELKQLENAKQLEVLVALLQQNTELTQQTHELSRRIDTLTREIHERLATGSTSHHLA